MYPWDTAQLASKPSNNDNSQIESFSDELNQKIEGGESLPPAVTPSSKQNIMSMKRGSSKKEVIDPTSNDNQTEPLSDKLNQKTGLNILRNLVRILGEKLAYFRIWKRVR